jgi:transcriptional regulator with XRE-family HTH domain
MKPFLRHDLLKSLGVKEISELSKLSKSYISQVKNGKRPPSTRLLNRLDYLAEYDE